MNTLDQKNEATNSSVCIITNHFSASKRKANIHWIAEQMQLLGFNVTFLVTGLSWLSYLKRDRRLAYMARSTVSNGAPQQPSIADLCLYGAYHPLNTHVDAVNRVLTPLYRCYPSLVLKAHARRVLGSCPYIILESGLPILFAPEVHRINPEARFCYRVSDDIANLRCHPIIADAERKHHHEFDLVSVASAAYSYRFPHARTLVVHEPGVPTSVFDRQYTSPYPKDGKRRFVSIGSSFFDPVLIRTVAAAFPNGEVIVIGDVRLPDCPSNVRCMGEMAFEQMVPLILNADVGLAAYDVSIMHTSNLASSQKVGQFRYCAKPVVLPCSMIDGSGDSRGLFGYAANDPGSISHACQSALAAVGKIDRVTPRNDYRTIAVELLGLDASIPRRSDF